MTDYSHLSTPELNQLIHDLSRESARLYQAGLLDELTKESEALGLYTSDTNEKGLGGYNAHQTIEALRRTQPPSCDGTATTHPSLLGHVVWNAQEGA